VGGKNDILIEMFRMDYLEKISRKFLKGWLELKIILQICNTINIYITPSPQKMPSVSMQLPSE